MSKIINILLRILNPTVSVGGLEISDSHIRFFQINKGKAISASLRLPPQIVRDGKIIDKNNFKKILANVRNQLAKNIKGVIHVIVALPSPALYLQVFNLPYMAGKQLEESVKLNLQMISPMPFDAAYADWEIIDENDVQGGQFEVLGAFSEKENIDFIINASREAGFDVIAVEPAILSVVRAAGEVQGANTKESSILLNVSSEGMDFAGVKNSRIFFNYFVSWRFLYGDAKEVSLTRFQEIVVQYTRQVLNFSISRGNANMKNLLLIATALTEDFKATIEKNFELKVALVGFKLYEHFDASWAAAIGAYQRGLLSRSEDNLITLTSIGTEETFKASQTIVFIQIWRNILALVGGFLLLAYLATTMFLGQTLRSVEAQPVRGLVGAEAEELSSLKSQASEFNNLTNLVIGAKQDTALVSPYFEKIFALASGKVRISRILFQSFSQSVAVSGDGPSEASIIDFKNSLEKEKDFGSVQLPITAIAPSGERFTFSLSLVFISSKTE